MAAPGNERGQMLLAAEYYSSEHDAFVATLRTTSQPKALAAFADGWKKDPRPWARAQIFAYLAQPLNCPGHQPVVKRLFKHAEETRDHELMAAFLVAFDRQVRRRVKTLRRWDFQARTVLEEEKLVTPRDVIPLDVKRTARNPATGEIIVYGLRSPKEARLFTYRTRYYLRRRAWRYFRQLQYRDSNAYLTSVAGALAIYEDTDLQRGENILDSWGLMHICFGEHEALDIGATHIQLKEGRGLGDLTPAPQFPEVWKSLDAATLLLTLALQARARLVRVWAVQLYQREHASRTVPIETIVSFLEHEDAAIQQIGARLLESSATLGTLPVGSWLKLLQTKNEEALQRVCDAFARHVSADRLDLAQCIELACVRPVPVARLGQQYLRSRSIDTPEAREQLTALASANCRAVAGELAAWALGLIGTKENYKCDQVIRFFDSLLVEARTAAWGWLLADSTALSDSVFWSRLVETPHDDMRMRMVDYLQRQAELPGATTDSLESVWRSVLLGVHRGGRQKAKAVQQIAHAIIKEPAQADKLLPVLAVAVRSVRGPEARAGLAAVVSVVEAQPALGGALQRHLPEVKLAEEVA